MLTGSRRKPIVLLTDFGWSSYVGVMKGIILSLCPDALLVDLAHHVTLQKIREGAWLLLVNYIYFPKKSIFLAVVDPGVGTEQKALAVKTKDYYFIGPDMRSGSAASFLSVEIGDRVVID